MHQRVPLCVDHGGAPHLVAFGDQVDDDPVRQPGDDQGCQPAQRLVHVERRGQRRGRLGEQCQPFEFGQRTDRRRRLRLSVRGRKLLRHVEQDQRARLVTDGVGSDEPRDAEQ
ncbi:hypothetical protein GCM10010510_24560 [Streptomyces anandii JCM 4720]|nr:hypothetical protein GCM10010510_24560 [Streptomyces anandii JCM 4720]